MNNDYPTNKTGKSRSADCRYIKELSIIIRAINSEGECLLDVEKVIGSNPILPTRPQTRLGEGVLLKVAIIGQFEIVTLARRCCSLSRRYAPYESYIAHQIANPF